MLRYFATSALVMLCLSVGSKASLAQDKSDAKPKVAVSISANSSWALRLPEEVLVPFRGVMSFDAAGLGPGGQPLYILGAGVGGLIGVFVQAIAHSAIVNSARNSEKERIQAQADLVLTPYKEVLGVFTTKELLKSSVEKVQNLQAPRLLDATQVDGDQLVVKSNPSFWFTQDQKAIILDHEIAIFPSGYSDKSSSQENAAAAYKSTVRVVSNPIVTDTPVAFWTETNGDKLKIQSVDLVAKSIEIALAEAANPTANDALRFRTVKFKEGEGERIERAQVVSGYCDRLLIRNLRGFLMSVPVDTALAESFNAKPCDAPVLPK
jgi:hypothetical protein